MFDIREIKSIPSYQAFGRLQQAGCRKNYDPATAVIAALTSFEWRSNGVDKDLIKFYEYERTHKHGVFDPHSNNNKCISRLTPWNVVNPNTEREVCHD